MTHFYGHYPYETVVKVVPVENNPWKLVSLMADTEDIINNKTFTVMDNVMMDNVTVYTVFQDKNVPTFKVTITQTKGGQ